MKTSELSSVVPHRVASYAEHATVLPDRFVPEVLRAVKIPPLTEMMLLDDDLQRIRPVLEKLGFAVDDDHIDQVVGRETTEFRFTLIRNVTMRVVLRLPDEILTVSNRENRLALNEVRDLFLVRFGRGTTLYIFHDSNPHGLHKNLMEGEWPEKYGIKSKFIPMSDLRDIEEMQLEDRKAYLRRTLDLDDQPAGPVQKPAADAMTPQEMGKLADILASLPEFRDEGPRGRRVLVQRAGLLDFAKSFDFNGTPKTVAGDLVLELRDRGLGALVETIKGLEDLPSEKREFVAKLLESYSFT